MLLQLRNIVYLFFSSYFAHSTSKIQGNVFKFLWQTTDTTTKPTKSDWCRPAVWRASRTSKTNRSHMRNLPSWKMKSGPGCRPLATRYPRIAATGHRSLSVFPINQSFPFRKRSVLDCFIGTLTTEGYPKSSTAISLLNRWVIGSYAASLGTIIFPLWGSQRKQADCCPQHDFVTARPLSTSSRWQG